MIIGKFSRTSDGWSGTIQTLSIQTKARFVPNDKRENERAPDFRVLSGHCELGVAWRRKMQGEVEREFLSVMLDGPVLSVPLNVVLFESVRQGEADLLWKRHQKDGGSQE